MSQCVGVSSDEDYMVDCSFITHDPLCVSMWIIGFFLFMNVNKLTTVSWVKLVIILGRVLDRKIYGFIIDVEGQ